MIIFGTRGMVRILGQLFFVCLLCRHEAAQRLVRRARWFTLFFIPVFPFLIRRVVSCAYCGGESPVDREAADLFLAEVEAGAAPAVGITPPAS
ncbi:hypothetical protein [Clavibacter sp. CFBP 8614]|uniref:hypothetical protein n=1 Tax=unclassified Clavibacter TaxID=2626594 RepID=UPI004041C456